MNYGQALKELRALPHDEFCEALYEMKPPRSLIGHVSIGELTREGARRLRAASDLLAMLKIARECIAYCRRNHPDAQSGDGLPVEVLIDAAMAKAEGRTP